MAKMFYTLEEAAQKLKVSPQAVKEMTTKGQLQQFRDRDKLMFKRDQVDALASKGGGSGAGGSASGAIPLAESGDTDAIDLSAETSASGSTHGHSGIDVFESGEVPAADSMAQTQVSSGHDQDDALNIESVGSGSGLLDLTQESDDTSLGAELLDEIYPGADDSQAGESGVSGSAVFEGVNMESAAGQSAGLSGLGEDQGTEPVGVPLAYVGESSDPAGSGFGAGLLLGAIIVLVLTLVVVIAAISNVSSALTDSISGSAASLAGWCVGLLILSFILAFIGGTIGKAAAR